MPIISHTLLGCTSSRYWILGKFPRQKLYPILDKLRSPSIHREKHSFANFYVRRGNDVEYKEVISLYTRARGVNLSSLRFDKIARYRISQFYEKFSLLVYRNLSFFFFFSCDSETGDPYYVCFKTFRIVGELRLFVSESTRETFCLIVCSEYRDLCLLECCIASRFQVAWNDFPLKFLSLTFSRYTWWINANSGILLRTC